MLRDRSIIELSIVAIVGLYGVAVLTRHGQRFDDAAKLYATYHHFNGGPNPARMLIGKRVPDAIALIAATTTVFAVLCWQRHNLARATTIVCSFVIPPLLVAEILKVVLPHPKLSNVPEWIGDTTFPSGHCAFVTALAASWVYLAPPRLRRVAIYLAAGTVWWIMISVIGSAAHRPSDAMAGSVLASAWCLAVATRRHSIDNRVVTSALASSASSSISRRVSAWVFATVFGLGLSIAIYAAPFEYPPRRAIVNRAFFAAALMAFATAGFLAMAAFDRIALLTVERSVA